jgi:hypothetical protein
MSRGSLAWLLCIVGCNAGERRGGSPPDGQVVLQDAAPPPNEDGSYVACSGPQRLLYALGNRVNDPATSLFQIDPQAGTVTELGALTGLPPTSFMNGELAINMTVDRTGGVWVVFLHGYGHDGDSSELFACDPTSLACAGVGVTLQASPTDQALDGIAFVSNGTSTPDTLYVAGSFLQMHGDYLGTIDLAGKHLSTLGPITYNWSKLTGTSDGRLFDIQGFAWVELDTSTGAVKRTGSLPLHSSSVPNSAAAFWGGDLWLFEGNPTPNTYTSDVFRYSLASGALSKQSFEVPAMVVGAGVSTCAPLLIM